MLAAELFPGARAPEPADRERASACTAAWLADPEVTRMRDAVFAAAGAVVRVDFVERVAAGGFGLRAVRAALRPSETALDELAFECHVARAAGLEVVSAELLLLESDYTRRERAPDARELFRRWDVTREVFFLERDLAAHLCAQRAVLESTAAPEIEPSPHCRRPETCEFLGHCTAGKGADWIGYLPGLRVNPFAALRAGGAEKMTELPEAFESTLPQRNARASLARGGVFAVPDLAQRLAGFGPPADFLDFEAILPEVPVYVGTHPFEVVPFQWSAHLWRDGAALEQAEFLAESRSDPRRAFAESLLAAFAHRSFPIAVYSDFESDVLVALGRAFADLASELERVRARLRDLLPVVRRGLYHPGFLGSFSLKRVAPALCPGFTFSDLPGIADGGAASRAWLALARGELSESREREVLAELRAYCARDSLALARLLSALRELSDGGAHSSE